MLANGDIVNANAGENTDLFWALKGGGPNFGIVTRFDVNTIAVREIWYEISVHSIDARSDIFGQCSPQLLLPMSHPLPLTTLRRLRRVAEGRLRRREVDSQPHHVPRHHHRPLDVLGARREAGSVCSHLRPRALGVCCSGYAGDVCFADGHSCWHCRYGADAVRASSLADEQIWVGRVADKGRLVGMITELSVRDPTPSSSTTCTTSGDRKPSRRVKPQAPTRPLPSSPCLATPPSEARPTAGTR